MYIVEELNTTVRLDDAAVMWQHRLREARLSALHAS